MGSQTLRTVIVGPTTSVQRINASPSLRLTYSCFVQISIRQNFRLNGEDHYTIFDVPISVTNKIEFTGGNPPCDSVNNPLLTPEEINAEAANSVGILFAPGDSTIVQQPDSSDDKNGIGPGKPEANPGNGLGSGASTLEWRVAVQRISLLSIIYFFIL